MDKTTEKSLLKTDINFLEYPTWALSNNKKQIVIEKNNGTYTIASSNAFKLPTHKDCLILYFLLSKNFENKNNYKNQIELTRYEIAMKVFNRRDPLIYERIEDSLNRWSAIFIHFKGIFYEGDGYTTRGFHFIDDYKLDDDRKLTINFNEQFIEYLNKTKYFKYINFNELKRLQRPVSARLYEILIKTFKDRYIWQIKITNLAEKLTLSEIYPAHILPKLQPAVNEITAKTDLKIKLEYNEEKRICIFIKIEDVKKTQELEYNEKLQELLILLPIELRKQESVRNLLNKYLTEKGVDYVRANILYSTQNSKKNLKVYLKNALSVDWGEEERIKGQERLNQQELRNRQEQEKKLQEAEKDKAADEQIEKYMQYFKALSKQEQQDILSEIKNNIVFRCIPFEGVKIMTYLKNRENIKL